ncbi:MAG: ATP-binding protein [Candidatus Micrarchaeaceae archaeon]
MPDNLVISKILHDIIATTNSSLGDGESERKLTHMMSDIFGIEKVAIVSAASHGGTQGGLYDYVSNTKKPYVDNQLSEYSSFPELIGYKNRGFRSCAIVPVVINGRVTSIVEMLSNSENKFSGELINNASLGAYLTGLVLLYNSESEKSLKLASYFTSAFNSPDCQLLVAHDGRIAKANERSMSDIIPIGGDGKRIDELIGLGFDQLLQISKSGPSRIRLSTGKGAATYLISVDMISDRLLHLSLQDVTVAEQLELLLGSMDNNSYMGALYLDSSLRVNGATDSIKKAIGYDKTLLVGKSLIELTTERKRGEVKEMLEKHSGDRLHGTIDLSTSMGIPAHLRFVLSRWTNGYLMLFSDATADGYMESMRSAFTDFINGTSDIVITMDELGYIKDCNIPAEEVLGYSRSELIGKDMRALYADQSVFERDITFVKNGVKIDNSYASLLDKNSIPIEATQSIRLFRGSENVDYLIVVKELETKRRLTVLADQLEKEKNRISRLKSTGDLKSQFIYNISHELKTPLTNIKGFSKLLYNGEFGELNKDQLDYIATIMEEADRLMIIIQQVLDAAKLESEKMKLEFREVDLKDMENNPTIQAMRESAENKGLKFSWDAKYDVPKITADPNRLLQAFVNLIGNSVKFTDKGEIKVRIRPMGRIMVLCEVIDTGIGISDDDRHKLFRKFYEAPKRGLVKQENAGTGLGLSITQEIIRLHGGKINCESEQGKGSRFFFTLRIKPRPKKEKD